MDIFCIACNKWIERCEHEAKRELRLAYGRLQENMRDITRLQHELNMGPGQFRREEAEASQKETFERLSEKHDSV